MAKAEEQRQGTLEPPMLPVSLFFLTSVCVRARVFFLCLIVPVTLSLAHGTFALYYLSGRPRAADAGRAANGGHPIANGCPSCVGCSGKSAGCVAATVSATGSVPAAAVTARTAAGVIPSLSVDVTRTPNGTPTNGAPPTNGTPASSGEEQFAEVLLPNPPTNPPTNMAAEGVDGDGGQPDFSRPTLLERYGDIQVQLSSPISQVDGRGAAVAGEQAA